MNDAIAPNDTQLIKKVAYQVLSHFDKSYRWFTRITRGAQERFERGNWKETQLASKERITIYEQSLSDAVAEIYHLTEVRQKDDLFWQELKKTFAVQLEGHPQFELAETFYNSVIGRLFKHRRIENDMMFVLPSRCYLPGQDRHKVIHSFDTTTTVREMYESIFKIYRYNIPFENFERDLQNLEAALRARLNKEQLASVQAVEILKPTFFRGKAAYLIGRICMPDETLPFVIAMRRYNEPHMFVDALLTDRKDLSVIFGFARSYFMADTQNPAEVAAFLQELLPNKKHFELYMALGHYKHGKTVFYRNFLQHMDASDDKFEAAPGIRGLVMMVFHLPSYGVVFKIIKDEFAESKKITREHVKECYKLVKMSDRVGRMADTHEYVNFRFPLDRIEPELIEELKDTCASSLEFTESELIIKHMYIERKMTPLNLFLQEETDEEKITRALDELGLCIKQIAMANIFPGDMLHKNFGITRHGRVIFYDYDEICLMNERNFRALPKSDDPYAIDTLSVAPNDVFPEQFEHFIVGKRKFKDILKELHGDLMTPEYWHEVQRKCERGDVQHFTPYNPNMRFERVALPESGNETSN
ncbi:isocitrate dehydrogenase kinase/phosphatase [Alteromonas sp. KUL42]|uniref:bifunctional isocitrate dehydrogenase kinase/phosphatase n=1 Tax=Alteromonas sp. KUL42 TaxID=2480797 RepID=UPI00103604D2|nr:bifunctional isocitrate dehydrogenase kinase/phosphatase [Alteromonas sp. KUL42]TAP38139.1 bifunctional isocitrate dehydrogenase kinase/phosphatase [Alteromonas sp. KUL42]GEA05354.1 isocitrate dehydrogenase kinase/phosphatase [Alteromonas sp. KUL42]